MGWIRVEGLGYMGTVRIRVEDNYMGTVRGSGFRDTWGDQDLGIHGGC